MTSTRKRVLAIAILGILFSLFRLSEAAYKVESQREAKQKFEAARIELAEREAAPATDGNGPDGTEKLTTDDLRRIVSYGPSGITGDDDSPYVHAGIPVLATAALFVLFFALGRQASGQLQLRGEPSGRGVPVSSSLLARFGRLSGSTIVSALVCVVALYACHRMVGHVLEVREELQLDAELFTEAQDRIERARVDANGQLAAGQDAKQFKEDVWLVRMHPYSIQYARKQLLLGYGLLAGSLVVAVAAGGFAFRRGRRSLNPEPH